MLWSLGFLILSVAVPSLMYPKAEQDPAERNNLTATVPKERTRRMAHLLVVQFLAKCRKLVELGRFRQFQRKGGVDQLKKDFADIARYHIHRPRNDPFVAMGYAEGKKIVIKERRYTMEIKSLTSMGEYKLDQIV